MVGFNLLGDTLTGPPFFYYETIALSSKGVEGSSFLYSIMPEFVDSKFFYAAASKRGYIHNLLIENMSPLTPMPPRRQYSAPPRFLYLSRSFSYFLTKTKSDSKTGYEIRNQFRSYPDRFSHIPFLIRNIPCTSRIYLYTE